MMKSKNINQPQSFWIEEERIEDEIVKCLTLILKTRGCRWRKCLMCGFNIGGRENITFENLKNQLDYAISNSKSKFEILKIFTSGSFFDPIEVPKEFRYYVYTIIENMGLRKLIVESRPEFIEGFVEADDVNNYNFEIEVGIGLETSNDFLRENCINKGFTFEDFKKSAKILKLNDLKVRTYLLLKPPFLSEKEAIKDCIKSAKDVLSISDTVSINPVYVPKNTYIEKLWKARIYRPPWLWSAVKVLRELVGKKYIICDPVGAGSERAVHNCGKCDKEIAQSIKKFSVTQDLEILESLVENPCTCYNFWRRYLEFENICRFPC